MNLTVPQAPVVGETANGKPGIRGKVVVITGDVYQFDNRSAFKAWVEAHGVDFSPSKDAFSVFTTSYPKWAQIALLAVRRSAFKAWVEAHGGKVTGSVSRNTDYLVTNTFCTACESCITVF